MVFGILRHNWKPWRLFRWAWFLSSFDWLQATWILRLTNIRVVRLNRIKQILIIFVTVKTACYACFYSFLCLAFLLGLAAFVSVDLCFCKAGWCRLGLKHLRLLGGVLFVYYWLVRLVWTYTDAPAGHLMRFSEPPLLQILVVFWLNFRSQLRFSLPQIRLNIRMAHFSCSQGLQTVITLLC
jgi:hypothetical protein